MVAFDGGVYRGKDGKVVELPFPNVREFQALADKVVREVPGVTLMEELLPAIGLKFPKASDACMAAFDEYLPQFKQLSVDGGSKLQIFDHDYPKHLEIIVQAFNKVDGIQKVIDGLGMSPFCVYAQGNSTNDIAMLKWANELAEQQVAGLGKGEEAFGGGSVWVGPGEDGDKVAKYCMPTVEILQEAFVILARLVKPIV